MHTKNRIFQYLALCLAALFSLIPFHIKASMKDKMTHYPRFFADPVVRCDLEMLLNGGFAPLEGFLSKKDYLGVVQKGRLANGKLWPIPIVFPVHKNRIQEVEENNHLVIVDETNLPLAVLDVEDIYKPDLEKECISLVGCVDDNHPFSQRILSLKDHYYVGGKVHLINMPFHSDFSELRMTPAETKAYIQKNNLKSVVGFQTRNPLHRCHVELGKRTLSKVQEDSSMLLIHPVVGATQPGDIDYKTRIKCYEKVMHHYPKNKAKLAILPLAMRMAGPKEALWHALIRKNYGCTHFIVGRSHASPSQNKKDGTPFFSEYGAQDLVAKHEKEIGIKMLPSPEIAYVNELDAYLPLNEIPEGATVGRISGTKLRQALKTGKDVPSWFSYDEIVKILASREKNKGLCFYFVGPSGAGKTTLSQLLKDRLEELLEKPVVILDGDVFRKNITPDLGFSREDKSKNVRRMGFVASQIVKSGGVCLCANMAPYLADREYNRDLINQSGQYVEIYVNTPIEVCESRDVKGLYKLAREGKVKHVVGIDEPFEVGSPDIRISSEKDLSVTFKTLEQSIEKYLAPKLKDALEN